MVTLTPNLEAQAKMLAAKRAINKLEDNAELLALTDRILSLLFERIEKSGDKIYID